jgi:catechol 2,3-dioxygenase-like lactoylglutathione lyase family enzyme
MRILLLALAATTLSAQLPAPNSAGVAMGHLHLNTTDAEGSKKFWVDFLGAKVTKLGPMDVYLFPDVLVLVRKAEVSGGSEGSSVNHLGFKVPNLKQYLDKAKSMGIPVVREMPETKQAFLMTPDKVKVELTEEAGMSAPVAHHHIHFSTSRLEATREWYVKMFSAVPGRRGRFEAADVPGVNLSFSPSEQPTVGTKGRALDHIGFEVRDLESYVKKLQGMGVTFDIPYRKVPTLGIAIAFLTDPWGTYIELTEGLNKL